MMLALAVAAITNTAAAQPASDVAEPRFSATAHGDQFYEVMRLRLLAARGAPSAAVARRLGELYELDFQAEVATRWYRQGLESNPGPRDAAAIRLGLARMALFGNPAASLELLATLADEPDAAAAVTQLRGRLALNAGDLAGAKTAMQAAVAAAARSNDRDSMDTLQSALADLSVIASLAGSAERAAAYAAASGAGYEPAGINVPDSREFTLCDPAAGVRPDDRVIFDVIVAPEGRAARVTPVWASRPDAPIARFGIQIVDAWRWPSGKRPAAWTRGVRIAVACSWSGTTTSGEPRVAPIVDWMIEKKLSPPPAVDDAADVADVMLAALTRLEARHGADAPELLPILLALSHPAREADARLHALKRAVAIARQAGAPPPALMNLEMGVMNAEGPPPAVEVRQRLETFLARARAVDPGGRAVIEAELVLADDENDAVQVRKRRLMAILDRQPAVLAADDKVRRLAAKRLASFADIAGDHGAATALLRAVRLPIDLCSRDANSPAVTGFYIGEDNYPADARRLSLEGASFVEARVEADGNARQVRVVYSQPAGLFDAASKASFANATGVALTRSGRTQGCTRSPRRMTWVLAPAVTAP